MTSLTEFAGNLLDPVQGQAQPATPRRPRSEHPKGWEPGIAWDGTKGTLTTGPMTEAPDNAIWAELIADWNLDPATVDLVPGSVQVRGWDANVGNGEITRLRYYRATLCKRTGADGGERPDIEALMAVVRRHKPAKRTPPTGDRAFVVNLCDWQFGKEGTARALEILLSDIDKIEQRIKDLRRIGRPLGALYILTCGDMGEGCGGFYAMMSFTVELNRRDQVKLVRRILVQAIKRWAPLFEKVVVAGVSGNHGENRDVQSGKAFTDFGDNDDVAVLEQVAEIFAENPEAYGHVSFVIPDKDLTLTLDICGTIVALAHGHQAERSSGGTPEAKLMSWWKGQSHGMRRVGEASILFCGHYHHTALIQDGPRTLFITSTVDAGSQWWEETAGMPTTQGQTTMTIGADGWRDFEVIR